MNNRKDFIRASLGLATAQICHGLGWHSVHRSSHDILTDLLERYLSQVSMTAANISQTCCRTIPNLDDVALTFEHLGIQLNELQDYVQQVEPSPSSNLTIGLPVKVDKNLLDFSGEDYLPALIDMTPKVEPITNGFADATDVKEEPMDDFDADNSINKEDRPSNLSFRTDSVESPPYSPLEPKSLNVDALHNVDLTRPDLKVTTPKGYTPTVTTQAPSIGIVSMTNSVATIAPPKEKSTTSILSPKNEQSVKSSKKEKKESSKKPTPDKKESSRSLLSPPSKQSSSTSKGKSKVENRKSKSPSPIPPPTVEKKESPKKESPSNKKESPSNKKESPSNKKESPSNKKESSSTNKKSKSTNSPSPFLHGSTTPFLHGSPTPFLHGSPTSSLLSPPRKKLAMYQSDKKKPTKDKCKNTPIKTETIDTSSPLKEKSTKSEKSSKTKLSPVVNSPSPSLTPKVVCTPPEIKKEKESSPPRLSSPPNLSSPIIKKEKSSPIRTIIYPPVNTLNSSSSDTNQSPVQSLKTFGDITSLEEKGSVIHVEPEEVDEKPPPELMVNPIPTTMPRLTFQKSPEGKKKKKKNKPADSSEHEVDVMSLSQEESYTDNFKPNMFFPTFGDEKKKKKKKRSEKGRDEKTKKNDNKDKKDRKRKREEPPPPPVASIPRLTLKMGAETISESVNKSSSSSLFKKPSSPKQKSTFSASSKTPDSLFGSSSVPPLKKKKNKHKQKERDKDKDKEREKEREKGKDKERQKEKDKMKVKPEVKPGFYVETLTNTSMSLGGEVYYCPGCGLPDDGSPMIGCDSCDGWYHWPCVGIVEEPAEDEKWYCPNCPNIIKKKKKKKKRDDL